MDARKIHHENYEDHFKKLWESFHSSQNLDIIGKSNEKISTSSVLLSICSEVLYEAAKDILKMRELDLDDKMVVILPDFSTHSVKRFIDYLLGRTVTFENRKEEQDVLQLLKILRFRNFPIPENKEQEEELMDLTDYLDTYIRDDFKSEPMHEDNEDPDWKAPKPAAVPVFSKNKPKLRRLLPKPMKEGDEESKPIAIAMLKRVKRGPKPKPISKDKGKSKAVRMKKEFVPIVKQGRNGKNSRNWDFKAKPFNDDEKKELDLIKCCDKDVTKLNAAVEHLKDLTKDWQSSLEFMLREDNKFRCPICHKTSYEKKSEVTSHIREHIQEIHENVTICKLCKKRLKYQTK